MAEVFLAKRIGPKGFEKQLVIKRILPHLSASERFTTLFLREARLAALVDHPNLVHVSSFGEIAGNYYLAMEFVDGITVADLLAMLGTFTTGVGCRIAIDLLGALQAVHTAKDGQGVPLGLIHRDVTPRNVMITRDGAVKLLDFGIATSRDEGRQGGGSGAMVGTQRHMSPEQMKGAPLDARSDLFCVGVLLFQMLTGDPPFDAQPERVPDRPEGFPEDLWTLVARTLAINPEDRPTSARQLQGDLELLVASRGLEGTRAHLAELLSELVGKSPLSPAKAISRITHFTRTGIKRLTAPLTMTGAGALAGDSAILAEDRVSSPMSAVAIMLIAGVIVMLLAAVVLLMVRAPGEAAVEANPAVAVLSSTHAVASRAVPTVTATTAPASRAVIRAPHIAEEVAEVRPVVRHTHAIVSTKRSAKPGFLTIDTHPWTEVYLGDKKLGLTPMEGVQLPPGQVELELRNPKLGITRTLKVTIKPGQTTRVQRDL
jgi:serine/threonine-protein kinase